MTEEKASLILQKQRNIVQYKIRQYNLMFTTRGTEQYILMKSIYLFSTVKI